MPMHVNQDQLLILTLVQEFPETIWERLSYGCFHLDTYLWC